MKHKNVFTVAESYYTPCVHGKNTLLFIYTTWEILSHTGQQALKSNDLLMNNNMFGTIATGTFSAITAMPFIIRTIQKTRQWDHRLLSRGCKSGLMTSRLHGSQAEASHSGGICFCRTLTAGAIFEIKCKGLGESHIWWKPSVPLTLVVQTTLFVALELPW